MALEEYRRKRDFGKTPEPRPKVATRSRGPELSYLIQKHDATRLHYDFRLELDGVLLSWAVTKGPSLNPADKRLAVRTEDHPLSYGSFEGIIPQGQYGGGTVMLWDRGTWEPKGDPHAGLAKGHLSFELHGDRLKGGWDLIRMRGDGKRENWLLIKESDAESRKNGKRDVLEENTVSVASGRGMGEIAEGTEVWESNRNGNEAAKKQDEPKKRRSKSGGLEKLMRQYPDVELATLVDEAPPGEEWWHEIKFDGYRLLGFVADGKVALRTRNGQDWTAKFPSVVEEVGELKAADAVLDMEAVVLDAEGKSSFHALQEALGAGGNRKRIVAYAFDLLELDGKDLTNRPLRERKRTLETLLGSGKQTALRFSGHVEGGGKNLFDEACRMGLEGIVSKLADSRYSPGRGRAWLKIKCGQRQEFIIVGYSDAKSGGRALGALYLGYHDKSDHVKKKPGEMKYAGKVGTGFTMKSAKTLADRLEKMPVKAPVFTKAEMVGVAGPEWQSIHWVKPELLCEVAFTEWTGDGQLRHPSFQGLREDKDAAEVSQEKPVRQKASR